MEMNRDQMSSNIDFVSPHLGLKSQWKFSFEMCEVSCLTSKKISPLSSLEGSKILNLNFEIWIYILNLLFNSFMSFFPFNSSHFSSKSLFVYSLSLSARRALCLHRYRLSFLDWIMTFLSFFAFFCVIWLHLQITQKQSIWMRSYWNSSILGY